MEGRGKRYCYRPPGGNGGVKPSYRPVKVKVGRGVMSGITADNVEGRRIIHHWGGGVLKE